MHKIIGAVIFIILMLVGFLATPSLFDFANPDYLISLHRYRPALDKLVTEQLEVNKKIADASALISQLEGKLQQNAAEATKKHSDMTASGASPADIQKTASEFGLKSVNLAVEQATAKTAKENLEARKQAIEKEELDISKKLDASKGESTNLYLVSRALALGAIGALISIFAKFLSTARSPIIFDDRNSMARTGASMVMGAIAAVVVMGLFFTGFISIFSHAEPVSQNPDFWKVTILCLLAGTFSDRLFQAASRRMEQYLGKATQEASAQRSDDNNEVHNKSGARRSHATP